MNFSVDLRYFLPPLINLAILLLPSQTGTVSIPVHASSSMEFDEYPFLKLASSAFAVFVSLLFLFTSVKLPLSAHPITVQAGYFSSPLTCSLLACVILQPNLFWVAYFIIISPSPWHGILWELQKCFFKHFVIALKAIPTLGITFTQRQNNYPEPEAARSTSGLVAVDC